MVCCGDTEIQTVKSNYLKPEQKGVIRVKIHVQEKLGGTVQKLDIICESSYLLILTFYDDTVVDTTPWFFIRLAEVYLNYAECQIELGNNAEALKYINLIRNRALLPDATGKDIRTEYEYERTVELMFEGQRFF